MYTVIICTEKVLYSCRKTYDAFFDPFLDNDNIAFCLWSPEGETLNEAVPTLDREIAKHRDWRAVIVYDESVIGIDNISKHNPFDYVNSTTLPNAITIEEEGDSLLDTKRKALNKAVSNPLAKLSSWLVGAAMQTSPDYYENYTEGFESDTERAIRVMERYHQMRYEIMRDNLDKYPQVINPPKRIIAVAERNVDNEEIINENKYQEFAYSRFYEDNMYPQQLRYVACDVHYLNGKEDSNNYFSFLVFILSLAGVEYPYEALKPHRVYSAEAILEDAKISNLCHRFLFKLMETRARIDQYTNKMNLQKELALDNETAERLFESTKGIAVKVNPNYSVEGIRADYRDIGFVAKASYTESKEWIEQYSVIKRQFNRYFREPQRAIKAAINSEFRENNFIDDNRVLRLNDFQRENITYRLYEEEEKMVQTPFVNLFDSSKAIEQMDKTSNRVKKALARRMDGRHALSLIIVTFLLFAFGFLPLIINGFKAEGEWLTSAIIAGVPCLLFLLVILLKLLGDRANVVSVIKNFNDAIHDTFMSVERNLSVISEYLSHACNVMREHSVLNAVDTDSKKKRMALAKHRDDIEDKIEETYKRFHRYIDEKFIEENLKEVGESEAYEYDFTVLNKYEYKMPFASENRSIEFMQPGFMVEVPVDYLSKVVLRREELYD